MGFLNKKSMLVSLLALSLAACTSVSNPPPPKATDTPINLPCNGDVKDHTIDKTPQTIIFQTSGCKLIDVTFQTDNSGSFKNKRHIAATSGDHVAFDYDGLPLPVDGAYFYYRTDYIPPGSSTDGGGGGVIRN